MKLCSGAATLMTLVVFLMYPADGNAQGMGPGSGGHMWSDAQSITVTGIVSIDNSTIVPMYYIDTDLDGTDDYLLMFGPPWFVPSSGIERPLDGETVTIEGSLKTGMAFATLTVLSLNQQTWRVQNEYGSMGWNMEPTWMTRGDTLTVSGVVQVDSTYFYTHYYVDTDADGTPDYQLGLGPMWYSPSTVNFPVDGSTVEVTGWLNARMDPPMISVYQVDGEVWRSDSGPAPWAGSWMLRGHSGDFTTYCVTDSSSSILFPAGHMDGQMGGMMNTWPDSTFMQFWNVHPDSLPGHPVDGTFMGFYIDAQRSGTTGMSMMGGSWGGRMGMIQFSGTHTMQFHYTEQDLMDHGYSEDSVELHWWDPGSGTWHSADGQYMNRLNDTVVLTTNGLAQYYSLSASSTATFVQDDLETPEDYVLTQNYPNPFNPLTTITFNLPEAQSVVLSIFDVTGRLVARPVDGFRNAGEHRVTFDAANLTSGIYIYRLDAGGHSMSRILTLLR